MKSNKFVQGIFGLILSCFVIAVITSCTQPGGGYSPQINYLAAVDGVPDEFLGTWENNDGGWHSEYILKKNQINDVSMGVIYNVVSDTTVTSDDKYILIFCQVAKDSGTQWTPSGYFYVAAVKKNNTKIDICCVVDPSSVYKTIDELKIKYTAEYSVTENGNFYTTCDFVPKFRTPVEGVADVFVGTWENNDWGYHSEYAVSKNQINDKSMGVLYNVVSTSTVTTTDGYTLVFCQVAEESGTQWTPEGNYYAVGLKLEDDKLKICCPLDYNSVYETLVDLNNNYTSSYNFASSGNFETVCTKMGSSVTLNSDYYIKIIFEKDKVALYPGTADPEWYFVPTRNKGKEKGNVVLYLYSSQDKLGVSDGHYLTIQYNADVDGKVVYWYCYEDESEEDDQNDENLAAMYPDCMPTVSDSDLEKILALYE